MGYQRRSKQRYSEADMLKAMKSLESNEFQSIRATATHFQVPESTLRTRQAGTKPRAQSHEAHQILSNAEEKALVQWVIQSTSIGNPVTPALLKQTAQEIRNRRVTLTASPNSQLFESPPIGHEWLYRFLNRFPNLKGTYSRQLESSRYKEANVGNITAWFHAFEAQRNGQKYELQNIYNMDETGFSVGTTQSSRIIVDITQKANWKVIPG